MYTNIQQSDGDPDDEEFNDHGGIAGDLASGYRRLITIHAGKPKGRLRDELANSSNKVRRLSLSEMELEKAASSYAKALVRYKINMYINQTLLLCTLYLILVLLTI